MAKSSKNINYGQCVVSDTDTMNFSGVCIIVNLQHPLLYLHAFLHRYQGFRKLLPPPFCMVDEMKSCFPALSSSC